MVRYFLLQQDYSRRSRLTNLFSPDRSLRYHVRVLLLTVLPRRPCRQEHAVPRPRLPPLRPLLRFHGRPRRAVAQEEQHDGAGTRLPG